MRWLPVALALALPAVARPYVRTTTQSSSPPCPDGVPRPLVWPGFLVPYVIDAAGSDDIHDASTFAAVDASFATWAAPACTGIRFRADGTVASAPVGFDHVNAVKWIESGWTQSAQAIAVTLTTFECSTGAIVDADIILNGETFLFTTAPSGTTTTEVVDVQNTVTHEVGHVIGFDHSSDSESTMYPDTLPGETKKRDLTADDIDGVCAVYPVGGPPPPPAAGHGGGGCSSAGGAALPGALLAALVAARRRRARVPVRAS